MTDDIIEQVLSKRPELSREELLSKLEMERKKTGGLISDATLLRLVAAEFGVEVRNGELLPPLLLIMDLVPGLMNVTVVGRVLAVFSPRTFSRNSKTGKFASLLIADRSGILRVVLWNHKTSLIDSGTVKTRQVARFSHGYTKEDRRGRVELHFAEKSEIEVEPKDVDSTEYPTISEFASKIGEIGKADKKKRVHLVGVVKRVFSVSAFVRQDSSNGKVVRLVLADETGEVSVVVWNEKVDELEKQLQINVRLQIVDAKVKKAVDGGFEIHVDSGTYVETVAPEEYMSKIADLNKDLSHVNVKGTLLSKPIVREVKTSKEERVKVASFELKDESGRIWVSAWRHKAEVAASLKTGDMIVIKDAYLRKGFGENLEISTRETTTINVI
jgi:replication factor A1